jgi:hypothetical protein
MIPMRMPDVIIAGGSLVLIVVAAYIFGRRWIKPRSAPPTRVTLANSAGDRFLTLVAVVILMVAVGISMYFIHKILGLDLAYWIVPVFGALGGLVGSLIRNVNYLNLVSFDSSNNRVRLGFVGDVILGLGGSAVVSFLFENTLRFEPEKKESYPLMISVCFLAGVFGQLLIMKAGKEWLAQEALDVANDAKRQADRLKSSAASAFVIASLYKFDKGLYEEALKAADEALGLDPDNIGGAVAKARALKRLARVAEAIAVIERALRLPKEIVENENEGVLLYNKACYRLLLEPGAVDEVLKLLERAFILNPGLKASAVIDPDLAPLGNDRRFLDLL